ncbi:MAG: hypothetical protein KJ804_06660 [Proteobacteria bacterium]|nr:hypothetical protein [Pseudomonadota bacterium]MBU1057983.1 hypothetical protein [Pseudomonadota bacterium]
MEPGKILSLLNRLLCRKDNIAPSDKLIIKKQQAIRVFCIHCKEHVFYLKSKTGGVALTNLAPLADNTQPTDFDCPLCQKDVRAYSPATTLKTDRGYFTWE